LAFVNTFRFAIDYYSKKNQFYVLLAFKYFSDLLSQKSGMTILEEIIDMV